MAICEFFLTSPAVSCMSCITSSSSPSGHTNNTDYFDIRSYQTSLIASLLDGIHWSNRNDECKFLLVGEHWCVHVLEFIEESYKFVLTSPAVLRMCCCFWIVCVLKWCSPMDTPVCLSRKNYIHQFCVDTGCRLEDLRIVIVDGDGWWQSKGSVLSTRLDNNERQGSRNCIQTEGLEKKLL